MTAYVKAPAKHFSVRPCQACGANRLCRKYGHGQRNVLWLCIGGPSRCWRQRRAVKATKVRAAA